MTFAIIDSGPADAAVNMDMDWKLLNEIGNDPICQLHFYDWKAPSATYGHFNKSHLLLSEKAIAKYQLQLAKRPTGGGLIFHQYDFAFSLLLSSSHHNYCHNVLESYCTINRIVGKAVYNALNLHAYPELYCDQCKQASDFCMAKPTVYDLMLNGRKVVGAAQRRTRHGLLHQGSISLQIPPHDFLNDILAKRPDIATSMQENSYPLLGNSQDIKSLSEARKALKYELTTAFSEWSKESTNR